MMLPFCPCFRWSAFLHISLCLLRKLDNKTYPLRRWTLGHLALQLIDKRVHFDDSSTRSDPTVPERTKSGSSIKPNHQPQAAPDTASSTRQNQFAAARSNHHKPQKKHWQPGKLCAGHARLDSSQTCPCASTPHTPVVVVFVKLFSNKFEFPVSSPN